MESIKKNWKAFYLVFLIIVSVVFLILRKDSILSGDLFFVDSIVIVIFIALVLSPLFNELQLFGFTFKSELRGLKNDIKEEITALRAEINNNVSVSPSFNLTTGLSPELEQTLKELKQNKGDADKIEKEEEYLKELEIPNDFIELFKIRFAFEKKLMNVAELLYPEKLGRDFTPVSRVISQLLRDGHLNNNLAEAYREIFRITSAGIHGVKPSSEDLEIARELTPPMLWKLDEIIEGW